MFKKKKHSRVISDARKRAQKISQPELKQWIDVTLFEVGRAVRSGDMGEATMWSGVLNDLVEELTERPQ